MAGEIPMQDEGERDKAFFSAKDEIRRKIANITSSSELETYIKKVKTRMSKEFREPEQNELLSEMPEWIQQNSHIKEENSSQIIQAAFSHEELIPKEAATFDLEQSPKTLDLERIVSQPNPQEWAKILRDTVNEISVDEYIDPAKKSPTPSFLDQLSKAQQRRPLLGKKINNYLIIKILGEGGMGCVYLGVNLETGEQCAVKSMLPKNSLPSQITPEVFKNYKDRFKREAEVLASLKNEHIVRITDIGESEGLPYYSMEMLPESIPKKANSLEEAINLVYQAGCGLEAAHLAEFDYKGRKVKGIAHRDIKPDNLRISSDGTLKVVDFGLAAIMEGEVTKLTQTGTVMGTPMYMSPEQITFKDIGIKSDVFSLGLVFYKQITGKLPFGFEKKKTGEIQELHLGLLRYDKELLKQLRPSYILGKNNIPAEIDDLIYLMLQPDSVKRIDMTEFLDILKTYNGGRRSVILDNKLSVVAECIKYVEKERWWSRNKKKVIGGLGLVAAAAVALTYFTAGPSSEEMRLREDAARNEALVQLYKDALDDKNPASALPKLRSLIKEAERQKGENPSAAESLEEMLSEANRKIESLEKEKEKADIQTRYDSLRGSLFKSAFEYENKGEYEKAIPPYEEFIKQIQKLMKDNPKEKFSGADKLLEEAGGRLKGAREKAIVQKYDKRLAVVEKSIKETKYDDARVALENLLVEFGREPGQNDAVKNRISEKLASVNRELFGIRQGNALTPLQEKYATAEGLEKAQKLIDAKSLYEQLIEGSKKALEGEKFPSIEELLEKVKEKPSHLHQQIIQLALEEKLPHSHKEIVEYMIASVKSLGEPTETESLASLEERKSLYEIILKEMVEWKVGQMEDSLKEYSGGVFPKFTTSDKWGSEVILTNASQISAHYPKVLLLAYNITKDKRFLDKFKSTVIEIKKLLKSPKGNVNIFPYLADSCFDLYEITKNQDDKNIALEAVRKYAKNITNEGFYKNPSNGEELIIDAALCSIPILLRAHKLSGDKEFLDAAEKRIKGSLDHQYDSKIHAVHTVIIKEKGKIKPEHTTVSPTAQLYAIWAYSAVVTYTSVKKELCEKTYKAMIDISDNYLELVKQNIIKQNKKDYILGLYIEKDPIRSRDAHNIMAVALYHDLANITKESKYSKFAEEMFHNVIVNDYLNTNEEIQAMLKHCVDRTSSEKPDTSSIEGDLYLGIGHQKILEHCQKRIQQKKQEEKQQEKEKGSMHQPKELKPLTFNMPELYQLTGMHMVV